MKRVVLALFVLSLMMTGCKGGNENVSTDTETQSETVTEDNTEIVLTDEESKENFNEALKDGRVQAHTAIHMPPYDLNSIVAVKVFKDTENTDYTNNFIVLDDIDSEEKSSVIQHYLDIVNTIDNKKKVSKLAKSKVKYKLCVYTDKLYADTQITYFDDNNAVTYTVYENGSIKAECKAQNFKGFYE